MVQSRISYWIFVLFFQFASISWGNIEYSTQLLEPALQTALKLDAPIVSYYPEEFNEIRTQNSLSIQDFYDSLLGDHSKFLSAGKSGSLFIITSDRQFILKEISHNEFKSFLNISAQYFNYIRNNPNTLLVKFFGLYKTKAQIEKYFLIMPNLAFNKNDRTQVYDLKGRTKKTKRNRKDEAIDDNNCPNYFPFQITFFQKEILLRDISFLSHLGIMDYSLFLVEQDKKLESIHIIDYLTVFDWKKRIANLCKRCIWDEQKIATLSPDKYADRITKLIDRLYTGPIIDGLPSNIFDSSQRKF